MLSTYYPLHYKKKIFAPLLCALRQETVASRPKRRPLSIVHCAMEQVRRMSDCPQSWSLAQTFGSNPNFGKIVFFKLYYIIFLRLIFFNQKENSVLRIFYQYWLVVFLVGRNTLFTMATLRLDNFISPVYVCMFDIISSLHLYGLTTKDLDNASTTLPVL